LLIRLDAEDNQESIIVSQRRGSIQVAVPCIEEYQQEVDNADKGLGVAMNQFAIIFEGRVPMGGLGNSFTQNSA
jgi:hypothetical protein